MLNVIDRSSERVDGQAVAGDRVAVDAGVLAVLNFAPGRIQAGKDVRLKNVAVPKKLAAELNEPRRRA